MTKHRYRKLVLVDIDGTLIAPGMTPRRALAQAIADFTGQTITFRVEQLAGNTDPLIVSNALEQLGIPPDKRDGLAGKILWRYLKLLIEQYPAAEDKQVFPGARELITYLLQQPVRLGLITGNLLLGAYTKLRVFGLWDCFSFGVFGDDSYYRTELPPIALKRAAEMFGEEYHPQDVLIIGDTVNDVLCAHQNGMVSVIVLRREEWRAAITTAQPELLVSSFEPLTEFQEWFERWQKSGFTV